MILYEYQVREFLLKAGFSGIALNYAVKICRCESSFDTNAHNTNGEDSRGLMQINIQANPQYSTLNLFDPQINCNVAYELYLNSGKKFYKWTCARNLGLTDPNKPFYGIALALMIGIALYLT